MERPDLTYLTQQTFFLDSLENGLIIHDNSLDVIFCCGKDESQSKYAKAILNLNKLTAFAEMLYDQNPPDSLTRKWVLDVLNELKEEK